METLEQLKTEISSLKAQLEKLELLNRWYEQQLKLNRQKQFGRSSEKNKYDIPGQISFFNEAESLNTQDPFVPEPTMETAAPKPKKKTKRGDFTKSLPVETISYELPESEQSCPQCNHKLHVLRQDIRKELKVIPAQVVVVEHVSQIYTCRNCEKNAPHTPVIQVPAPKALVKKSLVSPSMMAYIMNQKYTNAMPLNRQEQELKRFGVNLSRQNLSNWILKGATMLNPLLLELTKELLTQPVIHADETVLEVLCEPNRSAHAQSYMWVYRTSSHTQKPVVIYDYQEGRSGQFAKKFLSGFSGYLHTDGWGGYKRLEPEITLCGCWAHMRRKFDEACVPIGKENKQAPELVGLSYCNQLFGIEKQIKELTFHEKWKVRQKRARPIADECFQWVTEMQLKSLPQSLLGKALTYAQNQKKYLLSYLMDGRLEISNNLAERSIKPFVIGRKNWLFSNTPGGAKASAIIYSVIQTALENQLKPFHYLQYVFEQLQLDHTPELYTLLPWSNSIPDFCKINLK